MIPCLPAEARTLLAFQGPDAVRYLNGQLSQEVRDLGERSLPACVTDAKGRLQFYVFISQGPDGALWVDAPAGEAEALEARLTRYLIADEVEVRDLSAEWQLCHAAQPPSAAPGFRRESERLFAGGVDLWLPADAALPDGLQALDAEAAEGLRISRRLPAWGHELTTGLLPPEAGLDRTAISYRKGCYIGQEVLSRIKTAGKLNRRLAAFEILGEARPGDALQHEGREVGQLTSVSPHPSPADGRHAALGYLEKAGYELPSFELARGGTAHFAGYA